MRIKAIFRIYEIGGGDRYKENRFRRVWGAGFERLWDLEARYDALVALKSSVVGAGERLVQVMADFIRVICRP
jgi:hypothetical protein